jgi:hypothetical protein
MITRKAEGDEKPRALNYARPGTFRKQSICTAHGAVAGFISLTAILAQLPWASFVGMVAWSQATPGVAPSSSQTFGVWCILMLPSFVALPLGLFSIVGNGLSARNLAGIAGTIFSVIAIAVGLWKLVA